uniref:Nucleoside-diphosphate kinase n=1 Tax=Leptocylindrus danicus TaxID=163516 RepID=A0A7S2P314_9STRA
MAPASTTDLLFFTLTSAIALFLQKRGGDCPSVGDKQECAAKAEPTLKNSAFVFIKPHANTEATRSLVKSKLIDAGLDILSECDITGPEIDEKKLIDQHYYAIASKATILPAKDIPVPTDKFQDAFGEKWEDALAAGKACNAMEACAKFGCSADELNAAWGGAKVTKFGGGFYCGLVTLNGQSLYVFNAFFMSMRSKFVGAEDSIHCYEVEWKPDVLSWSDFRNNLLGPTDPADGPAGSIRKTILEQWEALGLSSLPNKGDNGVHASASPFEGLAEKNNWLKRDLSTDAFGAALLAAGLSKETIEEWSVDPRVELPGGEGKGSVFDALEDMDAAECLSKLVELNELNAGVV